MARLCVEEEVGDSDSSSLPELLSVLNLRDTPETKTAKTTQSKKVTGKVTTTTARNIESLVPKTPRHHQKVSLLSAEDSELGKRTTGKNHCHRSTFIAFGADYESCGSDNDSPGSLADFVVDDGYVSYESGNEQENTNELHKGRDRHDETKSTRKSLRGREHKPRIQPRRPLVSIPTNLQIHVSPNHVSSPRRLQRCYSSSISSGADDDENGSEGESAGSLADFVVDDDYICYESEDEQENSDILCEGRVRHEEPGANRKSLGGREEKQWNSPATGARNPWIRDKSSDSRKADSAVSDGLRGVFKNTPTDIMRLLVECRFCLRLPG